MARFSRIARSLCGVVVEDLDSGSHSVVEPAGSTTALSFTEDGHFLIGSQVDGQTKIWDPPSAPGTQLRLRHEMALPAYGSLVPCGGHIFMHCTRGKATVCDAARGKILGELQFLHNAVDWVFVTPDGRYDGVDVAIDNTTVRVDGAVRPLRSLPESLHTPGLLASILIGH